MISPVRSETVAPAVYENLHLALFADELPEKYGVVAIAAEVLPVWTGLREPLSMRAIDTIANRTISSNWVSSWRAETIGQVYLEVLNSADWGRKPFSASEELQYQEAANALFEKVEGRFTPTQEYRLYLDLKREYDRLRTEWDSTPENERTHQQKLALDQAREDLQIRGREATYLAYLNTLSRYSAYDYARSVHQPLLETFQANTENELPRTDLVPAIKPYGAPGYWLPFKFAVSTQKDGAPPYGYTPPNLPTGFWIEDPSAPILLPTPKSVSVSGKFARIRIDRPWMDLAVLTRPVWRWPTARSNISSGFVSSSSAGEAPLTFLVSSIVLLRELVIQADWPDETLKAIAEAPSIGKRVRFGPLAISGHFQGPAGQAAVVTSPIAERGISITSLQVVGSVAQLVPLAPAPSSDLIWHMPLPDYPVR